MALYSIAGTIELPEEVDLHEVLKAMGEAARGCDDDIDLDLDQIDRID